MDKEPVDATLKPGDIVRISDYAVADRLRGTVDMGVLQGPPGPPGEVQAFYCGTSETPELYFDVDGWRFSFASVEIARKVREKLMKMTLNGEL